MAKLTRAQKEGLLDLAWRHINGDSYEDTARRNIPNIQYIEYRRLRRTLTKGPARDPWVGAWIYNPPMFHGIEPNGYIHT